MKKNEITILIVDDEASIRESISEAVKKCGFKPVVAERPEEALSLAKLKSVHAAVVDCMLPKMNGVELAKELRASIGDAAPIVFISGVFRDKGFANESIKKVKALDFLHKPFSMKKLTDLLEKNLESLIDAPKVALHSLLSKPFASNRERRKALDHVEEALGYDLPLILCILMDAESTGYLNIINSDGEIFGFTFVKGRITSVDSSDSEATISILLQQQGFLTPKEIQEVSTSKKKGSLLKILVDENLMSPHAAPIIRNEQMFSEIRRLVSNEVIQINFAPDRKLKSDGSGIDLQGLSPVFHETIDLQVPVSWLAKFYDDWMDHPIRLGPQFSGAHPALSLPAITRIEGFVNVIKKELTIEEILQENKFSEDELFKAIHILAIRRIIVFDESRRSANLQEHISRLTNIFESIKGKNSVEVFKYFGSSPRAKVNEVEQLYKEFAKANHPDLLPLDVSEDIKKLNNEVFSIVSNAHDVLTNEDKRKEYVSGEKQKEAEIQLKAEAMVESALVLLRSGKAKDAYKSLKQAYDLYRDDNIHLHLIWAQIKALNYVMDADECVRVGDELAKMPIETKRTPIWMFVNGMFLKSIQDHEGASLNFHKALQAKPDFLDARREIVTLRKTSKKMSTQELLSGDLTEIVGNFFKKK